MVVIDVLSLVGFTYSIGYSLITQCEKVKQCHTESARIAVRTSRVLGSLEGASSEFGHEVWFQASILELKALLEEAYDVVGRCKRPRTLSAKASALGKANTLRDGLLRLEADLERILTDLKIPMQSEIKRAVSDVARKVDDVRDTIGAGRDREALAQAVQEGIRQELHALTGGVSLGDIIQAHRLKLEEASTEEDGTPDAEKELATGKPEKERDFMNLLGRIRYDRLEEDEDDILGEGTFGTVRSGVYKGNAVAIKRARGAIGDQTVLSSFRREAQIHFAMHHENIVRILGFSVDDPERPPCLVMELMEESLFHYLRTPAISPSLTERLSIVNDVVQGLRFLHERRIVHRDVKSPNVLLDVDGTAKLSDFGLAVVNTSVASSTGIRPRNQVGSTPWMAPEVHMGSKVTRAADVYGVHVIMWEVLEHRTADTRPSAIGEDMLRSPEARLFLSTATSTPKHQHLQTLLHRCGSLDSKLRPSMSDVFHELKRIVENVDIESTPAKADVRSRPTADDLRVRTLDETRSVLGSILSDWDEKDRTTLNSENRAIKLNLYQHGMHGMIPSGIWRLTALQDLDLSRNKLTGPIPPAVGELVALVTLKLWDNRLSGRIPPEIGRLKALQQLCLSWNKLSGPIPREIGELRALRTLRVRDNLLSGVIPPELGRLSMLRQVKLMSHNILRENTFDRQPKGASGAHSQPQWLLGETPFRVPPENLDDDVMSVRNRVLAAGAICFPMSEEVAGDVVSVAATILPPRRKLEKNVQ